MKKAKIVLDTNSLISSLSRRGNYYAIWKGLQNGKFILCVSNEIILEYLEVIGRKTNKFIAENVVQYLLNSKYVENHEPSFKFGLISSDPDDNKFVDCAIAAGAKCIVSNDKHYNVLQNVAFPHVEVVNIARFLHFLENNNG